MYSRLRLMHVPVLLLLGCCGSSSSATRGDAPDRHARRRPRLIVPRQPLEIQTSAMRKGGTLRVDVIGTARGHEEGETLEDPSTWTVVATAGGAALTRVVNAPARVEREPVGEVDSGQWDVVISFSIFFQLPREAMTVHLRVVPPEDEPAHQVTIDLEP